MKKAKEWIVGICNTEADGVTVYKVTGTESQVKRFLIQCVKEDKAQDGTWNYGSTKVSDIECRYGGCLYAYGAYSNYHIDYEATPVDEVETFVLTKKTKKKEEADGRSKED